MTKLLGFIDCERVFRSKSISWKFQKTSLRNHENLSNHPPTDGSVKMWTSPVEKTFSRFIARENISPFVDFDNSSWLWSDEGLSPLPHVPRYYCTQLCQWNLYSQHTSCEPIEVRTLFSDPSGRAVFIESEFEEGRRKFVVGALIVYNKSSLIGEIGSCAVAPPSTDRSQTLKKKFSNNAEGKEKLSQAPRLRGLMDVRNNRTGPARHDISLADPRLAFHRLNY